MYYLITKVGGVTWTILYFLMASFLQIHTTFQVVELGGLELGK